MTGRHRACGPNRLPCRTTMRCDLMRRHHRPSAGRVAVGVGVCLVAAVAVIGPGVGGVSAPLPAAFSDQQERPNPLFLPPAPTFPMVLDPAQPFELPTRVVELPRVVEVVAVGPLRREVGPVRRGVGSDRPHRDDSDDDSDDDDSDGDRPEWKPRPKPQPEPEPEPEPEPDPEPEPTPDPEPEPEPDEDSDDDEPAEEPDDGDDGDDEDSGEPDQDSGDQDGDSDDDNG